MAVSRSQLLGLVFAAAAVLSACGIPLSDSDRRPPAQQVPRFSRALLGSEVPDGWYVWTIHAGKARTRYEVVALDGERVVRADADSSASGLMADLSVDPSTMPILTFRWRTEALVSGADSTQAHASDSPVRVMLAFDGDKSSLPVKDRLTFERVRLLSGREMPYATLVYIWENRLDVGTVQPNLHTGRIRKLVASSGPGGVGQWQVFRRDIVADYQRAFGELPGRLVGVGIMSDTDNTKQRVRAYYGDIQLHAR